MYPDAYVIIMCYDRQPPQLGYVTRYGRYVVLRQEARIDSVSCLNPTLVFCGWWVDMQSDPQTLKTV